MGAQSTAHPGGNPFEDFGFGSDLFEEFFGHRHRNRANRASSRGKDRQIKIDISFLESVLGTEKSITYSRNCACEVCNGQKGTGNRVCSTCNGSGSVLYRQSFVTMQTTCPTCKGVGREVTNKCAACNGQGINVKTNTVTVRIPAGVFKGNRLRVSGCGDAGPDTSSHQNTHGDLYVELNVVNDPNFARSGNDIHSNVTLSVTQAMLGCAKSIETIHGVRTIKIPQGTQPDSQLKLYGLGVVNQAKKSPKGNHILHVDIKFPTVLTEDQKSAIQNLSDLGI